MLPINITWDDIPAKNVGIGLLAHRVATTHPHEWGEDVGRVGEQAVKDVIDAGGMNPTKKGGPRRLTDEMYNNVGFKVSTSGGTTFVEAGYGYSGSTPLQTFFQEEGTRKGITPMLSIPMAHLEMQTEATNANTRLMTKIAVEWDAL